MGRKPRVDRSAEEKWQPLFPAAHCYLLQQLDELLSEDFGELWLTL